MKPPPGGKYAIGRTFPLLTPHVRGSQAYYYYSSSSYCLVPLEYQPFHFYSVLSCNRPSASSNQPSKFTYLYILYISQFHVKFPYYYDISFHTGLLQNLSWPQSPASRRSTHLNLPNTLSPSANNYCEKMDHANDEELTFSVRL